MLLWAPLSQEKCLNSINGFLSGFQRFTMYTINVKTELLPLLGIIDFPCGKLVKTIMMRRKKKVPVVPVPDRPYFFLPPLLFSASPTVRPYFLQVVAGCSYSVPKWRLRAANYCRTSDNVRLNLANVRAKVSLIGHWSDHKKKLSHYTFFCCDKI